MCLQIHLSLSACVGDMMYAFRSVGMDWYYL